MDKVMPNMKRNVIILTSGLTGSSVLSGLISRGGFWTGDTHKKEDYDTYENKRLIELNLSLIPPSQLHRKLPDGILVGRNGSYWIPLRKHR